MKRRCFIVWHQDSPGTRVVVVRRFKPRSPFSRVGELYFPVTEAIMRSSAADLTKD